MKNVMLILLSIWCSVVAFGQSKPTTTPPMAKDEKVLTIPFAPDETVVTSHTTTIKGQKVPMTATTGTMPVWDADGKAIAGLFYTYYERSDVKDRSTRPLIISFNGGPGTAAVWMQIGYLGPHLLNVDDEGYPVQPYGIKENPFSLVDVADIVFVNPVNTGYSRPLIAKEAQAAAFFGVTADIKYFADWINTFVTRNNRWASPKYLIGESYGTTRVSAKYFLVRLFHTFRYENP